MLVRFPNVACEDRWGAVHVRSGEMLLRCVDVRHVKENDGMLHIVACYGWWHVLLKGRHVLY